MRSLGLSLALLLLLAGTPPLEAQDEGTIAGEVVHERTGEPLGGAQIQVGETGLGTLSGSDGTFAVENVPAGTYTVRAELLGFRAAEEQVQVTAGETVTVTFALDAEALGLDQLLVTGEAAQARRREIGHSVGTIATADLDQPVRDTEDMLQGRVAGVSIRNTAGSTGAGSQIRMRGLSSVSMSNQPLIYVDGVLMRSDPHPQAHPPVGYSGRDSNIATTPLQDINPEDIESIEIVRGAAATTMYGSEAAAGVIEIHTKSGQEGATRWNFSTTQGFDRLRPFGPDHPDPLREEGDLRHFRLDPWLRNGHTQHYNMSVSGGLEGVSYFLSARVEDDQGILPNDHQDRYAIRGNFSFQPLDDLTVRWNNAVSQRENRTTPSGNNAHGLTLNTYRGDVNYVGGFGEEAVQQILNQSIGRDLTTLNTSLNLSWMPRDNFTHTMDLGYNRIDSEMRNVRPFGFVLAPTGIMSNRAWTDETITAEYTGTYRHGLTPDIGAEVSWGGQIIETDEVMVTGYAEDFAGPGEATLTGGALSLSFEERERVITGGFFGQTRFDWQDRLFLTAGLRVDGNSAFGEDLGLETYPKVSASHVISEESFWRDGWGDVQLRAAWGQSGRAPGAFDAVRTWSPTNYVERPAFQPGNLGNPELGPERTTELEVGFNASWLRDRLTVDFTHFRQTTEDALLWVSPLPSEGGWSSQLENVGEMQNTGFEVSLEGTPIAYERFGLELGLNISTTNSEMIDMGDADPFTIGAFAWVREGEPVPVLEARRVENPDEMADPQYAEELEFVGPNEPTRIIQPRAEVRLPRGIRLNARGEFQGGHYMYDGATGNGVARATEWPACQPVWDNPEDFRAYDRSKCDMDNFAWEDYIYSADFFRLRNLSLTVPMDFALPWGDNARVTLSLQDWFTWTNEDWFAMDPEMGTNLGAHSTVRQVTEHVPPASRFMATFHVDF